MEVTDDVAAPSTSPRRLAGRVLGLLLGLALPTAFFAWLFGFDAIKKRINGRLWCSDADEVVFDVRVTSSGGSTRFDDALLCRKDGAVVRTIGDARMMATNIGVALGVSLVLLALLVACLWIYSRLRPRAI